MRKIIHFDMDYYFAQVEERDNPKLAKLPVAIGGGNRGVLCTANYIARKYGVRSAMPTFQALKLCPDLVLIPPNSHKYRQVSEQIFEIFHEYTDLVQGISLDEAYLDVTGVEKCFGSATLMAKEIKDKIYKKTKLTGSAGVSCNKLLAKISSEFNKPNGLFVITPDRLEEKVRDFSIREIQGVGKVTANKMDTLGIKTFGHLQKFSIPELVHYFGKFGPTLYHNSRGLDFRQVVASRERKSLSVENTFESDLLDLDIINGRLEGCYDEMMRRLQSYKDRAIKNIFVKIKYADFTQTTIEQKMTNLNLAGFKSIFESRYSQNISAIRLLGVGVKFYSKDTQQLELAI